jgi:autotransporter-associated beta strand protein
MEEREKKQMRLPCRLWGLTVPAHCDTFCELNDKLKAKMRYPSRIAALIASFIALAASATPPPGYYLVWGDEFNGTSLDPTKWWVWNQQDRSGYTVPQAVTVSNGVMTIHTYSAGGQNYSGIVSSDGRFRARYGYSEASVEFNGSPGMFSDFWLNSANNGQFIGDSAAEGAEIDVCEHRVTDASNADNISGQVTIDLHWDGYTSGVEHSFNSPLYGSGLGTGFHTYGLLWNSNGYNVSLDGVSTMSTNGGLSERTEIVLFSCEVDSNSFCGIVPPGGYGDFNDSTTSTVVDYFRFYAPTTTVYWLGGSSANWSDGGNWLSNMIPNSACDVVFSYLSAGNFNINLDTNIAVNSLSLQETPGIAFSGNTLTINNGGVDMLSAINSSVINSSVVLGADQPWTIGSGLAMVVNGAISGPGGMNVNGLGTVVLNGADTSTGITTVSSGALQVNNSITGPVNVTGGVLYGGGPFGGGVTVDIGTLTGTGTFNGPVTVNQGCTISPGSPTGALTINNTVTLGAGSITLINVNKTTQTNGQIAATSISLGGTLVITNLSGSFAPGDSFNIFSAGSISGAFSKIIPSTPGPGLAWDSSALAAGTLRVISTSNATLTAQLASSQVAVSWSAFSLGWQLQVQTNPPGVGLTSNWVNVAGSALTNLLNIPINPNVGSVFYRLVSSPASPAVFGASDVVVLEVGNGSISASGAPGVLLDFAPTGGANQYQVSLPASGGNALIFGGSSYDGGMSLSGDGHSIVIPGYNVALGSFSGTIDSSSTTGSSAVPRAVGIVHNDGTFSMGATTTSKFSGSTIRSAVSDGAGNFWAGGGSSGIDYLGSNFAAATVAGSPSATRNMVLFNGSIYFTETGSGLGVMSFAGAPVSAASPGFIVNTAVTGGTSSPQGLAVNSNIVYVADNRVSTSGGGVLRFNWNGSSWVYAYTLANNLTSSKVVDDLAVDFSGPNPVLYAVSGETTGNHIIVATDTGSGSTWAKLAGATSGNAFRGIVMAPR